MTERDRTRRDGGVGDDPRRGEGGEVGTPHVTDVGLTEGGDAEPRDDGQLASSAGWIAIPVGRAESGPTIAELVETVREAGGMVGGDALFDPRYEAEMRRFLIRALELEGIPIPGGGGTP